MSNGDGFVGGMIVDKDKQAKLEAKGWVFGDADDFLRPDTKQICEAIKGLPDNDRLQLHVRPTYKSDEWGMNRYLTTESDASIATDDLKALVAENARLKTEVVAANKGAQVNALVNESLAKKLKLAVEALNDTVQSYDSSGNRDCRRCDDLADISRSALAKIKEPSKGGEQR
jgi:hypothetical protein